ncbi:MAG: hypothetical protein JW384_02536 [Nitrosomonadaceae bacterium]|nr:hypothetical protein [Nitrosomonadaceae bacterium]
MLKHMRGNHKIETVISEGQLFDKRKDCRSVTHKRSEESLLSLLIGVAEHIRPEVRRCTASYFKH